MRTDEKDLKQHEIYLDNVNPVEIKLNKECAEARNPPSAFIASGCITDLIKINSNKMGEVKKQYTCNVPLVFWRAWTQKWRRTSRKMNHQNT
jgi:hypothetical protein